MCVCVGVGVFVCVHLRKKKMRRGKLSLLVVHGEEREKKVRTEINKITNTHDYSNHAYMHGYCSNCA